MELSAERVALAAKWAAYYRGLGYNPLPSHTDPARGKRPMVRYQQWWSEPAPADLFERHPTTNIQLMCGRRWGLLVIDLDGYEAYALWKQWGGLLRRTWMSSSGGGGMHVWFSMHADGPLLKKGFLWKGDGPHTAIERLGERSLVMAPPSIHPKTGNPYLFLRGCSPKEFPRPAPAPYWLLELPTLGQRAPVAEAETPALARALPARRPCAGLPDWRAVLAAIPDKVELARSWGLRLATGESNGWYYCHAIGREDKTASAQICAETGWYSEPGAAIGYPLFELGVRLGVFASWEDAVGQLASVYLPTPQPRAQRSARA